MFTNHKITNIIIYSKKKEFMINFLNKISNRKLNKIRTLMA